MTVASKPRGVCRLPVALCDRWIAFLLSCLGAFVYLFTMEPSVSFWDCGEFIATSYGLKVGHPPGAPTYNIFAILMMTFGGGDTRMAAWWCNALSALAGGVTVGLLYASILRLVALADWLADSRFVDFLRPWLVRLGGVVGSLCYLASDTAWFSATESEVYSLATMLAAAMLWCFLCWATSDNQRRVRWLLLASLLCGLAVGVHQLALLVLPAVMAVLFLRLRPSFSGIRFFVSRQRIKIYLFATLFFIVGLSTYCIIPIRAVAGSPSGYGDPSTVEGFGKYLSREQYEKAPFWPRSWRKRPGDDRNYALWQGKGGDFQLLAGYQMGYMYFRYLMWNFSGRFNDRQGFGGLQNGQFATGIAPIDALVVGSGARPPDSIGGKAHNCYYALPLLLGLLGVVFQFRRPRAAFATTLTLFLCGGVVLNLYLNHPVYEPRERDYAYVLSFYAFAIWIAFGAMGLVRCMLSLFGRITRSRIGLYCGASIASILLLCVPLLMACQNWDDHSRRNRYVARDVAANMLNSCAEGSLLVTYGDNDTFPLWYAQQVEGVRPDVQVANINLCGGYAWLLYTLETLDEEQPVFFTNYTHDALEGRFRGRMRLEGMCYRLCKEECDSVGTERFYNLVMVSRKNCDSRKCQTFDSGTRCSGGIQWHSLENVYVDPVGRQFLEYYWRCVISLCCQLVNNGNSTEAAECLDVTASQIPTGLLADKQLIHEIAIAFQAVGNIVEYNETMRWLRKTVDDEQKYYNTIRPSMRRYVAANYQLPEGFLDD